MIQNKPPVVGKKVRYVPWIAKGDQKHKDCQDGVITSWDNNYVYVNYCTGYPRPQATNPENLVWL